MKTLNALTVGFLTIVLSALTLKSVEAQPSGAVRTSDEQPQSGEVGGTDIRLRDGSIVHMADYTGVWQGTVRMPDGAHSVALEVTPRTIGDGMVASMTTSAQKPFSVLVDTISVAHNRVQMGMATAGTHFAGTLNANQTEIRGTWQQDGKAYPLTLRRVVVPVRTEPTAATRMASQLVSMAPPGLESEDPTPGPVRRRTPVFSFLSHTPVAYDWIPHVGNQDRPYGVDYW
jgi:hypothetical protein